MRAAARNLLAIVTLVRVMQIAIGIVFLSAPFSKALRLRAFEGTLAYLIPSFGFSRDLFVVAALVIVVEAALGWLMILNIWGRPTSTVAFCVLLGFTAVLVYLSGNSDAPSCRCGGWLAFAERSGQSPAFGLIRNVAMLWAVLCVYRSSPGPATILRRQVPAANRGPG